MRERMDSWWFRTAFSILDLVIPEKTEERSSLLNSLSLTTGDSGVDEAGSFHRLLQSTFTMCRKVLEESLLRMENGQEVTSKVPSELPLKTGILTGEDTDSRWFYLMSCRFALQLSQGSEQDWCEKAFERLSDWLNGRAEFPLEVRLRVLQILEACLTDSEPAPLGAHV